MRFTDRPAVPRRIVGFHRDAEAHWVAELACGHTQHVRHEPPLRSHPWVRDADARARRVGTELWCARCAADDAAHASERAPQDPDAADHPPPPSRMPDRSALADAFDAALRQVDRALADDMPTLAGERSARPELERLRADLHAQRAAALEAGAADPEWVRRTVRWVVEWAPETELPLVAALGGIARASAPRDA